MSERHQQLIEGILDGVDVKIDGDRPWDIRVNNPAFFTRVLAEGSLGLGEAYMDGWWDCDELAEAFGRIFAAGAQSRVRIRTDETATDHECRILARLSQNARNKTCCRGLSVRA